MIWTAKAPSNIALIKYMGKKDPLRNIPDNASLSYTLPQLETTVRLTIHSDTTDRWAPLKADFSLSSAGQARFLAHFAWLKQQFDIQEHFLVESANNFPHNAGLASSASSFAALTLCAVEAFNDLRHPDHHVRHPECNEGPPHAGEILDRARSRRSLASLGMTSALRMTCANLSRQGSGSSCRSFFSPFALWEEETVQAIDLPYTHLLHQVIMISKAEKTVSSSEAHRRIQKSPDYPGRPQRATERLTHLITALKAEDWSSAVHLCWDEFQDMHALFHTAEHPFTYMTPKTLIALEDLERQFIQRSDGPIVTMDAGPNIHLLYREDQTELASEIKQHFLLRHYDIL